MKINALANAIKMKTNKPAEISLSDKIYYNESWNLEKGDKDCMYAKDVKEAVKKLKEALILNSSRKNKIIPADKAIHIIAVIFGRRLLENE